MSNKKGEVKWMGSQQSEEWVSSRTVVDPKYSKVGERIRHFTPSALQCSMFCGGKQCKYDNPAKWKSEEMAIKGLYSSWITNKILAMARPSSYAVKEYCILEQFKRNNITAIMNLQHPGEHSSCGFGLQESGFSYDPQEFMDQDVFFYNFGWDDYGVRALQSILDMVKVMDFALMDGKVAIHCHAGLGRTGVLIACYFVYSQRMKADEAINTVRSSRPKAIQTRGQIACVRDFEMYLKPMWIVYANACRPDERKPFSLDHFLRRQAHLLHGEEERDLRYVPKIVFVTCQRLIELAGLDFNLRSISLLKRRAFTSLTHNPKSSESIYLHQESSESSFSQNESSDNLCLKDTQSINDDSCTRRIKSNSTSEFLVRESYDDEQVCLETSDKFRYFSSIDPDPSDYGGVEEIKPERVLRHSSSESALLMANKRHNIDAISQSPLQPNANEHVLSNIEQTLRSSDSVEENSMTNDNSEKLSINNRTPSNDSGITNSCLVDDDESLENTKSITNNASPHERSSSSSLKRTEIQFSNPSSNLDSEPSDVTATSLSSSSSAHSNKTRSDFVLDVLLDGIECSLNIKQSDMRISNKIEQYKADLNSSDSTWRKLKTEKDACVLCCLLWSWLDHLQEPVITDKDLQSIAMHKDDSVKAFQTLDRGKRKTLQVILCSFLKITSNSEKLFQRVSHWVTLLLIQQQPSPKKTKQDKVVESSTSEPQEQTKQYLELSKFIKLLCKSDILNN